MTDIVERLRDQGKDAFSRHYSLGTFKLCDEAATEIERLRNQLVNSGWQPIETAPPVKEWGNPPSVLLWVADGGGKGSGCHAFGRVYRYEDGTTRAVASGFSGNWRTTHWMPLSAPQARIQAKRRLRGEAKFRSSGPGPARRGNWSRRVSRFHRCGSRAMAAPR